MLYFSNKATPLAGLKNYKPATAFEERVKTIALEWLSDKQEFQFQTSGATGQPKKITFTRQQMQASARLTQQTFDLKSGQTALLCLDADFVAGKMMVVRALEIGMNLIVVEPKANPIENITVKEPIAFAAFVPYQLSAILQNQQSKKKLSHIQKAIVGGASVSPELIEQLNGCSTTFYETYGMTETLTHVAIRRLNPLEETFRALPGVTLWLTADLRLSLQLDHLGIERVETNDCVQLHTRDTFTFTGRFDNIINTAGIKLLPEILELKIKAVMAEHCTNSAYFVGGVKDKQFGEKVVLFIESQTITETVKKIILDACKHALRSFEVPKEIISVNLFARTNSGKVMRKETVQQAFNL